MPNTRIAVVGIYKPNWQTIPQTSYGSVTRMLLLSYLALASSCFPKCCFSEGHSSVSSPLLPPGGLPAVSPVGCLVFLVAALLPFNVRDPVFLPASAFRAISISFSLLLAPAFITISRFPCIKAEGLRIAAFAEDVALSAIPPFESLMIPAPFPGTWAVRRRMS